MISYARKCSYQFLIIFLITIIFLFGSCSKLSSESPRNANSTYVEFDYLSNKPSTLKKINGVQYTLIDKYSQWATMLYLKKDFVSVSRHIQNLLVNSNEETAYDLYWLYHTLGTITADQNIDLMHGVLNAWCKKEPKSHIPWLVRGVFYNEWAWKIRGGSWAKDVPVSAWPEFKEKLQLAQSDLERSRALNPNDPNSYCFLIAVANGLGKDKTEMEKVFQSGITVAPWHYGLYTQKLDSLSPRWGGSHEDMMAFAERCHELSKQYPTLGIVVANAYLDVHKYGHTGNENFLGREDIWNYIDSVFTAVLDKYPADMNRHFIYAYYAYTARKFDIAKKQFELIGNQWTDDVRWKSLESYNKARAFTYYKMGEDLLWEKGMHEMAIDYFQMANLYNPTGNAYYGLGIAYERTAYNLRDVNLLTKAEESFQQALKIEPNNKFARDGLNKLRKYMRKS